MRFFLVFIFILIVGLVGTPAYAKDIQISRLTCNYAVNPLGIDDSSPLLGWQIRSQQKAVTQTAYRILVASTPEKLSRNTGDVWDTKKVASAQSQNIKYAGSSLLPGKLYYWKVMIWTEHDKPVGWSETAHWSAGLLSLKDWQATWIAGKYAEVSAMRTHFTNWKEKGKYVSDDTAAIYMRKVFDASKAVKKAIAYISGLGYYELYLNGKKTGDRVMDPVFTDYQKTISYVTYDLTSAIKRGNNAIGVILGNGFYNSPSQDLFQMEKANWKTSPKLLFSLHIQYTDGTKAIIASDKTWKWNTGEIVYNSIRGGETIDHRLRQKNWHTAIFNDNNWKKVVEVPAPLGQLRSQYMPSMQVNETIVPITIFEPKKGVYIADFGKNITGWISLHAKGNKGQYITCRYNEVLNKDSTLNSRYSSGHTGGRFQQEEFILNGEGREFFEPRFTYHGFRYVQLEGLTAKPALNDIRAKSIHTGLDTIGFFSCSNEQINQLQKAVQRTLLNSIHGMPGEEATREKMGWTLDAGVTMESYLYNFDAINAYKKCLQDFMDAQEPNGHIASIVPTNGWAFMRPDGSRDHFDDPWWGGTIFFIAEKIFSHTGDTAVIAYSFDAMKSYVDYVASTANDDLVYWSLGDWLDMTFTDAPGLTPVVQTSTAAYYWMSERLATFARILNKPAIADQYEKHAQRIKAKFNQSFLQANTGWYADSSQTAQVLPLYLGMVPGDMKQKAESCLLKAIDYTNGHVSVGFVGVLPFLNYLPQAGYMDKLYSVFTQHESPGWLHMVKNANSTLGENLNSKGYGTGHHPYGAHIGSWLYKYLGGIRIDPVYPGFKQFIIEPYVPADLDWCTVKTKSLYGEIVAAWKKSNGRLQVDITIPGNSSAKVVLPVMENTVITVDGKPLSNVTGITIANPEKNKTVIYIRSGHYKLEMPLR